MVEILSFSCDTGGKTMKGPAPLQETMSEAPPPKIVPKALAGRIRQDGEAIANEDFHIMSKIDILGDRPFRFS
jgi:hypothetical protein